MNVCCPPIADTEAMKLPGGMLNLRSPWLPLIVGGLLLLLSPPLLRLPDQELLVSILVMFAIPLVMEGEAWREAAYHTEYFYEVKPEMVHWGAYNPQGALPRYALLYTLSFSILIGREAHAIPDNIWTVIVLVAAVLLWGALAVTSFVRDIRRLMKSKGIESNRSKRRHSS